MCATPAKVHSLVHNDATVKAPRSSPKPSKDRAAERLVARLKRTVHEETKRAGLAGKTLLAAVSGGPDSLALLHLLADVRHACNLNLHVAHLDHGLRDASTEDALFVAHEASQLGLPLSSERATLHAFRASRAGKGMSIEQAARTVRYAFLARVAAKVGAAAVAVGHTADDQAETILLHMVRGSGLRGLRGMQPISTMSTAAGSIVLFRPLLAVSRLETEAFCTAKRSSPRMDASNANSAFLRNRIRNELLPLLREMNPGVGGALVRLGHAAARDEDFLEQETEALWSTIARQTAESIDLDKKALLEAPAALRSRMLRRAYAALHGDVEGLEEAHVEAMGRTLRAGSGRFVDLPGGIRWHVHRTKAVLCLNTVENGSER
ncbi:MAG: tRNA lysidine(34) synthetase TilS [Dehalococcoidia bacterium]|nr:tRNA lysidine(34) synthetase TilS [Dehalococcoidia bacterium]